MGMISTDIRSDICLTNFVLKVASRCNLNCSYCYVYNKGDASWERRPPIMSEETFEAALVRIRRHCLFTHQKSVTLAFHGGEPTLIGVKRFDSWCDKARRSLEDIATVELAIQTNGTLLNQAWAEAFLKHHVQVGISMDGPRPLHNIFRVDRKGRGSYDALERGLTVLRNANVPFGILSVVQPGADPLTIHRHFIELGCVSIGYLMPAFTHDTIGPIHQRYGPTPCADFLIPIFDDWWFNGTLDVRIREFWSMARLIMGGSSQVDSLGVERYGFTFVETGGDIEGLDVLRICDEGLYGTGLTVYDADFRDIIAVSELHGRLLTGTVPLPQACRSCPECNTCAGGYLPHRYSRERGFDNPSVWCADLLRLFAHIRQRLEVSVEETSLRRQELQALNSDPIL